MMRSVLTAAVAASAIVSAQNIVQIAEIDPALTLLVDAITAGGLVSALEGPGPFTVFAPVNFGFEVLGRNILDYISNKKNIGVLDNVLTYHVANLEVFSDQLTNGEQIPTLDNEVVTVSINGATVKINNATVLKADIKASNGVIHIIDRVMVPNNFALPASDILTTALAVPDLSTLVTAVKAADITAALAMPNGPYTVFAPTNEAFAKIPADLLDYLLKHPLELQYVLNYHILDHRVYAQEITNFGYAITLNREEIIFFVNSSGVVINGVSTVVKADVDCTNGVVHLIDTVLIPKLIKEAAATWAANSKVVAAPEATLNIVQLAQSVPTLSILVKAVIAAGLVDTLAGPGPFTVFAPLDEAFGRLPNGVLDYLLQNPKVLTQVLLYHTVAGNVSSSQLTNNETITTVEGANAVVRIIQDRHHTFVFIDDAMVVSADNEATNGVVHIIDNVIFPPTTVAAMPAEVRRQLRGTLHKAF